MTEDVVGGFTHDWFYKRVPANWTDQVLIGFRDVVVTIFEVIEARRMGG